MSVENKQVRGDASVSRNVNAGGNARVQGSMHVGHNLRVDGAIEAQNIKAANKGLFLDDAQLKARYPQPEEGWFAGVGSSSPFVVYIARKDAVGRVDWYATNGTFSVDVDMDSYNQRIDDLESQLESNNALIAELIEIIREGGSTDFVMITLVTNNTPGNTMGSVSGGGLKQKGSVTVTATAKSGYHFVEWQDAEGNTIAGAGATYTFEATESVTLKAVFAVSYFTVTVGTDQTTLGDVSKSPSDATDGYIYNEEVTLTANPKQAVATAYFVHWEDAQGVVKSTSASYTFNVTENVTLKAVFDEERLITTEVVLEEGETDPRGGTAIRIERDGSDVSGNRVRIGDRVTLTATGTSHKPSAWTDVNGNALGEDFTIESIGNMMKCTFTYTGTQTLSFKAAFNGAAIIVSRTIKVQANNANYGDVHIEVDSENVGTQKEVPEGTEVSLVAAPKTGFIFDSWKKGAATIGVDATIYITVSDTTAGTYTAYFKHAGEPDFYFGVFDTPQNNPVLDGISDETGLTKGWLTDNAKAQITLPTGKTFVVLWRSSVVPTACNITDDIGPGTLDLDSQQSFYATTKTLNNVAYTAREFYGGNTGSGNWSVEITFAANSNSQE